MNLGGSGPRWTQVEVDLGGTPISSVRTKGAPHKQKEAPHEHIYDQ